MHETLVELVSRLWLISNRLGVYIVVNFADDPALLALAFC